MSRPTFVRINLAALTHNFLRVRALAKGARIMAMVKANAYGHGLVPIAKHLADADALGVASIDEGIILREAGITQPIVLMEGLFYADEVELAARYNFSLVIHHEAAVKQLELAQGDFAPFNVWLKINTGMNRLGIAPSELQRLYQRLQALPLVKKPIGLMTHFAEADAKDLTSAGKQLASFRELTAEYEGPFSLANSAAIMCLPEARADWVRPGLMLYGASPLAAHTGNNDTLLPVMTFWSRLIAIQQLEKGDKVGYGGTWAAPTATRIGVVAAGYGDGYPQTAKNGTPVLVNGVICPLVGRVSMDMLTVDLSNVPDAQIDDKVILWGEGLPVTSVAIYNQMSAYELLTRRPLRAKVDYQ